MLISAKMKYLGSQEKISRKSGSTYYMAKFIDEEKQVFEFYIKNERLPMIEKLEDYSEYNVVLTLASINGEAKVFLSNIH